MSSITVFFLLTMFISALMMLWVKTNPNKFTHPNLCFFLLLISTVVQGLAAITPYSM